MGFASGSTGGDAGPTVSRWGAASAAAVMPCCGAGADQRLTEQQMVSTPAATDAAVSAKDFR
ncbi:hypothetical protein D6T65_04215 [Arthrobacter frigidicola]|nr:hypothetical protein D6T65_04215 [Arthrobacter frigidicola]